MKQQKQHFVESLNQILDLQIDAIHELLETSTNDSVKRHNFHITILRRKQMVDQLEALILSHGGKIDKRTNIKTGVTPTNNGLNSTNDQLINLYSTLIEDDSISKVIRTTLYKHHELVKFDIVKLVE